MNSNTSNQYHSAYASMAPTDVVMPFMTRRFAEYCMKIPDRYVIGLRQQKIVLRQALAPFLPDDIRNRGKTVQRAKRDTALSDTIETLAARLLGEEHVRSRGLIDPAYVDWLRKRPANGIYQGDQLTRLWMLIIIEVWCRSFLDQRGEPWGFDRDHLWATAPKRL
jgi:asparagine synthase (glutamine-hydrolysing)